MLDPLSSSGNLLIGGVILSPIVPQLLVALIVTGLLSVLLMRLGFYRLVWQRPIVELSIFCILLGVIVAFTPDGWPLHHPLIHAGELP